MSQRSEAEPSMDDILASIRKIIAEEPVRDQPPPPPPVSTEQPPSSLSARLNDVFGSAPGARPWPSVPATAPTPTAAAVRNALDDDLAGIVVPDTSPTVETSAGNLALGNVIPRSFNASPPRPAPVVIASTSGVAAPSPLPVPPVSASPAPVLRAVPPVPGAPVVIAGMGPPPPPQSTLPAATAAAISAAPAPSDPVVIASMPATFVPPLREPPPSPAPAPRPFDLSSLTQANRLTEADVPPRPDPVLRMEFTRPVPPPAPVETMPPAPAFTPSPYIALDKAPEVPPPPQASLEAQAAASLQSAAEALEGQLAQVADQIAAEYGAAAEARLKEAQAAGETATLDNAATAPAATAPLPHPLTSPAAEAAPDETPSSSLQFRNEPRTEPKDAPPAPADGVQAPAYPITTVGLPSFSSLPATMTSSSGPAAEAAQIEVASIAPEPPIALEPVVAVSDREIGGDTTPAPTLDTAPTLESAATPEFPPPPASPSPGLSTIPSFSQTIPEPTGNALTTQGELAPLVPSEFDDTAAELLRPMLRHWLDANMPRIVEKALRRELVERPFAEQGSASLKNEKSAS